jgi:uncharacterized protein
VLSWNETKRRQNLQKHGVDFSAAEGFDWNRATVSEDRRFDYSEIREVAFAPIERRLHVLVFTRRQTSIHVISLRKANQREQDRYAKEREAKGL